MCIRDRSTWEGSKEKEIHLRAATVPEKMRWIDHMRKHQIIGVSVVKTATSNDATVKSSPQSHPFAQLLKRGDSSLDQRLDEVWQSQTEFDKVLQTVLQTVDKESPVYSLSLIHI
eukprot:TRINITY_DN25332_c0_g1_i1.p1 TRINITY_DN25332_c0_g1~~TRINITY_DN25332_c0_g1_i1.p1  ORF type:complete len:115 (-),score=22.05 TRINITY_DN25332_c0_g1_i1:56-400(-)